MSKLWHVGNTILILCALMIVGSRAPVAAAPARDIVVKASGTIEAEEVKLSAEIGGRVVAVNAKEGEAVEKGQLLVQMDDSLLLAQVAEAEAEVTTAQALLAEAVAGARPSEIAAARAEVASAQAELSGAQKAYALAQEMLQTPHDLLAQIDEARAGVEMAKAQVGQAQAALGMAQALRDGATGGSDYDKAKRAAYELQVAAAQADLEAAQEAQAGAEATLAALEAVLRAPLTYQAAVHRAASQVALAEAKLALAQARLDAVLAGKRPEEIAVAEAGVQQAAAALRLVQAQQAKLALRSPIDGLVTSRLIEPGELAQAGRVLMTVADLDQVTLQIFVPTDRIGRVRLEQRAVVTVDSFRGREFEGRVVYIADRAEFTPKNVQTQEDRVDTVFAVKIRLENPEHLLKPGMPADAALVEE